MLHLALSWKDSQDIRDQSVECISDSHCEISCFLLCSSNSGFLAHVLKRTSKIRCAVGIAVFLFLTQPPPLPQPFSLLCSWLRCEDVKIPFLKAQLFIQDFADRNPVFAKSPVLLAAETLICRQRRLSHGCLRTKTIHSAAFPFADEMAIFYVVFIATWVTCSRARSRHRGGGHGGGSVDSLVEWLLTRDAAIIGSRLFENNNAGGHDPAVESVRRPRQFLSRVQETSLCQTRKQKALVLTRKWRITCIDD